MSKSRLIGVLIFILALGFLSLMISNWYNAPEIPDEILRVSSPSKRFDAVVMSAASKGFRGDDYLFVVAHGASVSRESPIALEGRLFSEGVKLDWRDDYHLSVLTSYGGIYGYQSDIEIGSSLVRIRLRTGKFEDEEDK
jgi:hypothetical protein